MYFVCALAPPTQVCIYQDDDDSRKEEIAALAGNQTNVFGKFYDRLKEIREYHRRFPTAEVAEVGGWGGPASPDGVGGMKPDRAKTLLSARAAAHAFLKLTDGNVGGGRGIGIGMHIHDHRHTHACMPPPHMPPPTHMSNAHTGMAHTWIQTCTCAHTCTHTQTQTGTPPTHMHSLTNAHPACYTAKPEDDEAQLKEEPHVEWTGEEQSGRCLDLHEHYLRFINNKFGRKIEYFEYVSSAIDFASIPRQAKLGKPYRWVVVCAWWGVQVGDCVCGGAYAGVWCGVWWGMQVCGGVCGGACRCVVGRVVGRAGVWLGVWWGVQVCGWVCGWVCGGACR